MPSPISGVEEVGKKAYESFGKGYIAKGSIESFLTVMKKVKVRRSYNPQLMKKIKPYIVAGYSAGVTDEKMFTTSVMLSNI